jgi:hypothetical protein
MKLPRAAEAVVPRAKVEQYLLNPGHPVGGSKADFFHHFGFRREDWSALADALKQHAFDHTVASRSEDEDGATYLVEGPLSTPSGRAPQIRSVWRVDAGELAPRFITAYPLGT